MGEGNFLEGACLWVSFPNRGCLPSWRVLVPARLHLPGARLAVQILTLIFPGASGPIKNPLIPTTNISLYESLSLERGVLIFLGPFLCGLERI